ncbi:hypothetical protein Btru_005258 [Bulinus truncatus]|nr:hypothetical protein Btru_005258 [Bulinus truncatus]
MSRDGLIDAVKVGDLIRCVEPNPTLALIKVWGGNDKPGEKQYSYEEFTPSTNKRKTSKNGAHSGTSKRPSDRLTGKVKVYSSVAGEEASAHRHGERLSDDQVDEIIKLTDITIDLDGNVKYEDFINKVMLGPKNQNMIFFFCFFKILHICSSDIFCMT